MKDEFYADKRDLVKWGGIIHLCDNKKIKTVIQVAYYRKSKYSNFEFENKSVPLPKSVEKHFRDIKDINDIKRLGHSTTINIKVLDDSFDDKVSRDDYHRLICNKIRETKESKIVFLDPDVGLEPTKCKREHVKTTEVKEVFGNTFYH